MLSSLSLLLALVNAEGFVSLPFTKRAQNEPALPNSDRFAKRIVSDVVENNYMSYLVSFSLGNNQQQKGIIDTGSSDMWVYSSNTGAQYTYNPSGAQLISNDFEMSYFDGTSARGEYYKDTLTWGDASVEVQFGVSETFNGRPEYGWFGIGPRRLESSFGHGHGEYDNYPYALKNAGKIESVAYSLNLNRIEADSGTILFGAVDTSRYTGKLQLLKGQAIDRFSVQFSVMGKPLTGLLDSGFTYTFLPDDVLEQIARSVGASWSNDMNAYVVRGQPSNQSLTYDFSGTKIEVPASELLHPVGQGSSMYQLTIRPSSMNNNWVVLGDSFLRSAYVVYDMENNQMAVAQASWTSSAPNYQVITSAGIPGASF